jgi:hypothetical protein
MGKGGGGSEDPEFPGGPDPDLENGVGELQHALAVYGLVSASGAGVRRRTGRGLSPSKRMQLNNSYDALARPMPQSVGGSTTPKGLEGLSGPVTTTFGPDVGWVLNNDPPEATGEGGAGDGGPPGHREEQAWPARGRVEASPVGGAGRM